jgi:TIR domain
MKVLLSWSGENSKALAKVLREWLTAIFDDVIFWVSTRDIEPGKRWGHELDAQLETTHFGILCLVPSNVLAPWLLFEAGALSKSVDASRVVPYCFGLEPETITGPLSKFQGVRADEAGTRKLIDAINSLVDSKRPGFEIKREFDKRWPDLKCELNKISTGVSEITFPNVLELKLLDFIDCAERPVYLTDDKLIVRYCNKHLLAFIGARQDQIIGKHVNVVVDFFDKLVPPEKRKAFRKRQSQVIKDAETAPYACISEVVDLRQRTSGMNKRMYRVWIQADFISAPGQSRAIGSVVIYHPVEVTIDPDGKLTLPELYV